MRTPKLLLSIVASTMAVSAFAEAVPSHESYVMPFDEGKSKEFPEYFRNWNENDPQPLSEDENFYISRVPFKERFVNTATQVDPTMTNDRKFCLWTPMGISDTYWQSLPRYVFDGDNFSTWSYIDSQGGWSLPWVRVPGAYADVTHKNGVRNSGGLIFFDSWGGDNTPANNIVNMITEKEGDKFKYVEKFVKFLRYYGLDGVGVNPEGTIPRPTYLQDFFAECREYAESIGWRFTVYWYGTNQNWGTMDLGNELTSSKADWFVKDGKQVCDMYMLNYGASGSTSISTAQNVGGNTYDIYVGYDIQGNWLQGRASWNNVKNKPLSIVFWGNHTTDMIYQNSADFGSAEEAVQRCYPVKLEQVFSGGNRNPANRPDINEYVTGCTEADMKKWHGIAEFLPARSNLQELPFVTRFNLGNGKAFYNEGKVTFPGKWFNVGVQDYMPTWRWWITDEKGQVPNDEIEFTFNHEDAWFGGNSLNVSGATKNSTVRLFKTKFDIAATDDISLTYKLVKGNASHMELFWAFEGSENELHYAAIDGAKEGEWVTISKKASDIKMNGKVALIGLRFKDTPANYSLNLGEFSIIPATSFAPVRPTITTSVGNIFKKRTYNGIDFKFSWNAKAPADHPSNTDKSYPIYNEDVDTWYYEVHIQAQGGQPILCGTTSQWAHYVVGAPVSSDKDVTRYRVGVCAVAPDGKTKSAIVWSSYSEKEITLVDGIACNPSVIKSKDEFTLSMVDPYQPEPKKWAIINSITGTQVSSQDGGKEFKTSLNDEGYYDVILTKNDNSKLFYRGFVQISPKETGKAPTIESIAASKTEVDLSVSKDPITLSYVGEKNEGTASRGLEVIDPQIFHIPEQYLPNAQSKYSVGLWVKPTKIAFAKYGMSLINQRDATGRGWPHNNWGAFWCDVWPAAEYNGKKVMDANIVSYTMYENYPRTYPFKENSNVHETPNLLCCTDGNQFNTESYGLAEGVWSHVMITYDGSKQSIYFNGKLIQSTNAKLVSYGDAPIYIGGSRVYFAGLNGIIDDVQIWHKALNATEIADAMKGYWGREVPSDLKGYWTFEDDTYDAGTFLFKNSGTLQATALASYASLEASGENPEEAEEVPVAANIGVAGNPAMSGTLPIVTTATFTVGKETATTTTNEAEMSLSQNGTYDLVLTLANGWGAATMTNAEYITVKGGAGIEDNVVENLSVYPNPFVDQVNLLFAEDGNYKVELYDAQGRQLISKRHQAMAGEVFTLDVNAAQGLYYVVVSKDDKRVNTFKVIAQ